MNSRVQETGTIAGANDPALAASAGLSAIMM